MTAMDIAIEKIEELGAENTSLKTWKADIISRIKKYDNFAGVAQSKMDTKCSQNFVICLQRGS